MNEMIEKENEASNAQWSEKRRAKELRKAEELEAAKAEGLAEEKRETKRRKAEMRSKATKPELHPLLPRLL